MATQHLFNKSTYEQMMDTCRESAFDEIAQTLREQYTSELAYISAGETENIRWARLLGSALFEAVYGEVVEIDNLSFYVE